jgi:hypothetical protein
MHLTGLQRYASGTNSWDAMAGPALTGSTERLFTWALSEESLVFSQGVDPVMRMDFGGAVYAALNAGAVPARYITRAADRLFLAHTVEAAANKPFRVRRSVVGDHTDWAGIGAGFTDLTDTPYQLRGLKKFGSRLIVYTEKTAYMGTRTGLASAPYTWDPVLTETGLWVPHSLKGWGNGHIFIGNDDCYEFDGVQLRSRARGKIRGAIFNSINSAAVHRMFSEIITDSQEYLFFCAEGGSNTANVIWVYNKELDVWYKWQVAGAAFSSTTHPTCATTHRANNALSWDEMGALTWDEVTSEWDTYSLQNEVATLVTGHADGQVNKWGLGYHDDDGNAFTAHWASKDLRATEIDPSLQGRQVTLKDILILLEPFSSAWTFAIQYSTDRGVTWTFPYRVDVAAGVTKARIDHQVTGNEIRFKLVQMTQEMPLTIHSIHPKLMAAGQWT